MKKYEIHLCCKCQEQWGAWLQYYKEIAAWKYDDESKANCPNGCEIENIIIVETCY